MLVFLILDLVIINQVHLLFLELRAYDTPFIIRDGQLVGQLNYYEIDEIKKKKVMELKLNQITLIKI